MESIKTMAEFTDILRKHSNLTSAYVFIETNYNKMNKSELAAIIKELLYGVNEYLDEDSTAQFLDDVAVELDEQYDEAYQED